MSAYEINRPAISIAGFFATLFSAVAGWNDARMTRRALSKLSDRELEDIGLCRGDIETIVSRI